MVVNYYTLFHIGRHLDKLLNGWTVTEVFTQHKGELVIRFNDESSPGLETFVIIGCLPAANLLFARKEFHRANKNTVDLFPGLAGRHVSRIRAHDGDREVRVDFEDGTALRIQLFGSRANVLLTDTAQTVADAFLHKKDLVGTRAVEPAGSRSAFADSAAVVLERLRTASGTNVVQRLKGAFPTLGGQLAKEACFRSAIPPERTWNDLVEAEAERLAGSTYQLLEELRVQPRAQILFSEQTPLAFALVELQHLHADRTEFFDSIHDGIRAFLRLDRQSDSFLKQRNSLLTDIQSELDRIRRTLDKITAERPSVSLAEEYERLGATLRTNLHQIRRGDSSVLIEQDSGSVEIAIDAHLSPAKNAERYFEKARKIRSTVEEQKTRADELNSTIRILSHLEEELDLVDTAALLESFTGAHAEALAAYGLTAQDSKRGEEQRIPFRVFTVRGGFQAWAGKSGENNDLLTTRFTAKNDLWFHARGVGGSHVVLKVGTAKGEPTKAAVQQTASIAAYYSKMKNASMVPVTMCEGKFVRKPRGAPPGTVTVERETVIFVEPALPQP